MDAKSIIDLGIQELNASRMEALKIAFQTLTLVASLNA